MNSLLILILGRLLDGSINWKSLIQSQGLAVVNEKLRQLIHARVDHQIPKIAARMQRDGFTWDGTASNVTSMPDERLGRGFVLSRAALYRILGAIGVRGGYVKDSLRDAADNTVWEHAKQQLPPGAPLEDVVRVTLKEWLRAVL